MPKELARHFAVKFLCLYRVFLVKLPNCEIELLCVLLEVLKAYTAFTEDYKLIISDFCYSRLNTK